MKTGINDFSGGLMDFIFNTNPNQAAECNNLLITRERGLITRNGCQLYDSNNPQIPAGNQRIGALRLFEDQLFVQSAKRMYYIDSTFQTLSRNSSDIFANGSTSSYISTAEWNGHLVMTDDAFSKPVKVYKDASGDFQVVTAGLPQIASSPVITPSTSGDGKTYLYKFTYERTYSVEGIDFLDIGETLQVLPLDGVDFAIGGRTNNITGITALSGEQYDTTTATKIGVYRTIHNGSVFYKVGEVDNGTTVYVDSTDDDDLVLNITLYTEGGAEENIEPPICKFVTSANDIIWYGHLQSNPNRVMQSIQLDPDSVPDTFFTDFNGDITALGSVNLFPIVFTENETHRLENFVTFTGQGGVIKRSISDKVGCVSNNSIVNTSRGLYFAGNDGFYFTNGYQITKIAEDKLDITYSTLTNTEEKRENIYGAYDKNTNRVYWSMQAVTGNDVVLVFDETFNSFTSLDGGNSFKPTAILFEDKKLVRADLRGYLISHAEGNFNDLTIDTDINPTDWLVHPVVYSWKHIAFDFGAPDMQKWVPKVTMSAQNESNLDVQINSYDNGTVVAKALKEIEYVNNETWGSPLWLWNDPAAVWRQQLLISKTRRMPAGKLRTRYKQLELTNADTIIQWSDIASDATADSVTKRITMDDTDFFFVPRPEGYFISFATDGYTNQFEIIEHASNTEIEVSDPDGNLVNGSDNWQISGIPKNQRLNLTSLIYTYDVFGDKGGYYKGSESDGNE